jgi:hypothetical protein
MLTSRQIQDIAQRVNELTPEESSLSILREAYPGVHFTWCMDDDVGVQNPYAEYDGFNLYLIDGREHCLKFTNSLEHATGLVIAEVIADD